MIRSLIFVVLLLAAGLSGCMPTGGMNAVMVGAAGEASPGVPGSGPGAEAARAWGSWEKANEVFNRHIAEGTKPALAALLTLIEGQARKTELFVHTPDDGSPPYVTGNPPATGTNVSMGTANNPQPGGSQ